MGTKWWTCEICDKANSQVLKRMLYIIQLVMFVSDELDNSSDLKKNIRNYN